MGSTVSSIFNTIWDIISSPINIGIKAVNSIINAANFLPGVPAIPNIPELAEGVTNFAGGMALVGEEGPEMVNLPKGSNVITNENSSKLSNAGSSLQSSKAEQNTKHIERLEKIIETKEQSPNQQNNGNDSGNREIKLILNEKEFGRAIINIFNKTMKLNAL